MRPDSRILDRQSWRNWLLFTGMMVVTTIGLAAAVLSLLRGRVKAIWPWGNTEVVLLAGMIVTMLLFVAHITQQQRRVSVLRWELTRASEEAAARVRRSYDRLVALWNANRALAEETDPQAIFDSITRACRSAFECRQVSLLLLDPARQVLQVRSVSGADAAAKSLAEEVPVGDGVAGWVAANRKPLILGPGTDPSECPGLVLEEPFRSSAIIAPILTRGELIGVLSISGRPPGAGDPEEDAEDLQAVLLFAESAGICCRHAEQASWMRQTIHRLDAALRERDQAVEGEAA